MHPMVNTATTAARKAGSIISRAYDDKKMLKITSKGLHDYVTQIDKAAEAIIIDTLQTAYPEHSITAEESGNYIIQNSPYEWLVDPLDGTLNFINGFPHFCVSIALRVNNVIEHAVVYDPLRNELFTASKGSGAKLDNKRIRVNKLSSLETAFLSTGHPVRRPEEFDKTLTAFTKILKQCGDVRTTGSAALDLAYVAAGRLDGYWEAGLKPWDLAAGALLVLEAGGYVGDYKGGENFLTTGNIIASNMKVYKELLKNINS